jgi:hypothetical protein
MIVPPIGFKKKKLYRLVYGGRQKHGKKADGTFMLVTPDELSELKKENKITLTKLEEIRTGSLHLILTLKTV